jgi:hypothetical protein
VWTGVAGSPYYTNLYAVGPASTNNGNDLATAWRVFLNSIGAFLGAGLGAQIDPEILEFDETTGNVTGTGNTVQARVDMSAAGDRLPPANQLLIRWTTNGIVHNRRVKGRTFIPGCLETQNGPGGQPASTIGTPVQSAIDALLVTMSGRMRVWAQPFEGTPENPARPGSAHTIQSGSIAPYWAILRSRRD